MNALALKLERFDASSPAGAKGAENAESVLMQRARAEAYAEGYAAGQAAATGRAGDQQQLAAAVARALESEIASAPARAAADAGGALKLLLESIFPALSARGFAAEAAAAFAHAAREQGGGAWEIAAPKQHAAEIEKMLGVLAADGAFAVRADPAMSGARARAAWSGGGVDFDLEAATAGSLDAFEKALNALANEKTS